MAEVLGNQHFTQKLCVKSDIKKEIWNIWNRADKDHESKYAFFVLFLITGGATELKTAHPCKQTTSEISVEVLSTHP